MNVDGFCHYCSLKDGVCAHLKELMRNALRHTEINGAQLCPLMLAASETVSEPRAAGPLKPKRILRSKRELPSKRELKAKRQLKPKR